MSGVQALLAGLTGAQMGPLTPAPMGLLLTACQQFSTSWGTKWGTGGRGDEQARAVGNDLLGARLGYGTESPECERSGSGWPGLDDRQSLGHATHDEQEMSA